MTASRFERMALGAAALALSLAAGCPSETADPAEGYSARPLHPTDVGSVYVEMFTVHKSEFRRGYEFRLTEALAKRISSDTDYRIAEKAAADTILTGQIKRIDFDVLSEIGADVTRETQITIEADVQWQDLRSGEVLMEAADLSASSEYIPRLGEDPFRGAQAAVEKLARRIVERMESQW